MKAILKNYLASKYNLLDSYTSWFYSEDVNDDALTDAWLDKRTSYIYKVGVLCAIDSNKCDWANVVIGVQRSNESEVEIKGEFDFNEGENDDMGRVIDRAVQILTFMHPAFDKD